MPFPWLRREPPAGEGAAPTVLFLIHDLRPGGAERVFLEYLNRIRGFRVVPILLRPQGRWIARVSSETPVYHLERGGDSAGIHPSSLQGRASELIPGREGWIRGSLSLWAKAHRLAGIADRESAVLVSTFLHKSHLVALTAKLLLRPQLKVVINVHEDPLQHVEAHFPPSRRTLMRAFYRWMVPRADLIAAVAEGIGANVLSACNVAPHRVRVTPNPVDIAEIRAGGMRPVPPGELPEGDGPLVVGVGRLEEVKGFDLLIRAVGQARARLPIRLVLVGDGTQRRRLENLVAELGLHDHVKILGFRENPLPHMAAAELLVLPSRSEAWPCVIGEAMALGTPVLAAACSAGVEEYLQGGRCGLLVPPEDEPALGEGILALLSSPGLAARLAEAARSRVEAFDVTSVVPRYEEALRAACHPREGEADDA